MKNRRVVNSATFDQYALEVKISHACDTTVQKYSNLPLHYQETDFSAKYHVYTVIYLSSVTGCLSLLCFQIAVNNNITRSCFFNLFYFNCTRHI